MHLRQVKDEQPHPRLQLWPPDRFSYLAPSRPYHSFLGPSSRPNVEDGMYVPGLPLWNVVFLIFFSSFHLKVAMQRILGVSPALMRPPYGNLNNNVRAVAANRNQSSEYF